MWQCAACTMHNELGSLKCSVCETPKGTQSRKNIHRRAAETEQEMELLRLEEQKRRAGVKGQRDRDRDTHMETVDEPKLRKRLRNSKSRQGHDQKIAQAMLKRLKAKDVVKSVVILGGESVPIFASRSAGPNFGKNEDPQDDYD